MTDLKIEQRTDSYLLRLIARDHERLAPNAYHSAETLRDIANRLEALRPTVGAGDGEADRLMQDFYLSNSYDPNAARPADIVKAAIAFTLSNTRPQPSEPTPAIAGEVTVDLLQELREIPNILHARLQMVGQREPEYVIGQSLRNRIEAALASKSPPAPVEGEVVAGRTVEQWRIFARNDYCLERMVPSDLRQIIGALEESLIRERIASLASIAPARGS